MPDTPAQITYGHRGTYRDGEDAPLVARLQKAPASPGAQGTAFIPGDVVSIAWTLYRIYKGAVSIVTGYSEVSLDPSDVLLGALAGWQADSVGYNFRHVIDETVLAPEATYKSFYDFQLASGESFTIQPKFDYVGDDVGEEPGDSAPGNTGPAGPAGPGYRATSTTSLAIGTGSKSFATQSGLAYTPGARVRVSSDADGSNWMEGLATSYSGSTLVLDVTLTSGSGSHADWNINLSGEVGATGTGTVGDTGPAGPGYYATSTSSHTIGTGTKVFVTQSGLAYSAGARVRVSMVSDTDNWMEGVVDSYALTVLTVTLDLTSGSGSATSWNINLGGEPGTNGSGINLQGEWDSGTSYVVGDVVTYLGSSYAATVPNTNSTPTGVNPNWQLLASKGDDGNDGADYLFNVTRSPYSAVGDGSTDDTASIQAAFDAAETYAAAGGKPVVYLPEGTYKVGTATSAGAYAVTLAGSDIHLHGHGIIKLAAGSNADCALAVSGDGNHLEEFTVDGNAAGSPGGRGDCFYILGNDNTAHNVTCQNSKTTTGIDFLIIGDHDTIETRTTGLRNKWINCVSRNAGYNAFDNRGDFTTLRDCEAHDFGTHGYNHAGYATTQVTIDGLLMTATSGTALTGLIMDPGSGQTDAYVKHATIRNVRMGTLGASATLSPMKISRVHNLLLDGIVVDHTTNFSTIKLVEAIKSVTFRDCFFARNIDFDELSPASGSITSVADNGGFTQFTSTSHGLTKRDIIYIPDSSISGYSGLHEVTASDTNTFTTDCRAGTVGAMTGTFYDCVGSVTLERVQIGQPGTTFAIAGPLSGLRTPKLKMRDCWFYGCTTRAIAAKETFPITAVERYDIENCFFEFNRNTDTPVVCVLASEGTSAEYFTASRKIRWVNNSYRNIGNGTVQTLRDSDARILATSLDGGRDYILASGTFPSGTSVTWQVGDRFWKPSPASGKSPGWICTTAGTFSSGTFKPMSPLSDGVLVANTTEVGNVGTGEDNLISYTMPANTLDNDGDTIDVEAAFSFASNGNNKTVKLYIGADVVYDSGAVAQNGGSLLVRATLVRDTGVIAKVSSLAVPSASSSFATKSTYFQTATAFASSNVIKGTGEATSNNDVVMEYLRVQKRPSP